MSLTLLVSCSQEQESMSNVLQTDDLTWDENGVGFAEFLGCTKGPDFARENLEEMSEAFSQLALSENLMWSGAYVPVNAPEEFPDGFFWEFNARAKSLNFSFNEIKINHRKRSAGDTKIYTLKNLPRIAYTNGIGLLKLRFQKK